MKIRHFDHIVQILNTSSPSSIEIIRHSIDSVMSERLRFSILLLENYGLITSFTSQIVFTLLTFSELVKCIVFDKESLKSDL